MTHTTAKPIPGGPTASRCATVSTNFLAEWNAMSPEDRLVRKRTWFRNWLETKDAWLNPKQIAKIWMLWARPAQTLPEGDWRIWLMMGGRGAGKTRAGAEWVRERVERGGVRRVALVGPTLHDVREVMIE